MMCYGMKGTSESMKSEDHNVSSRTWLHVVATLPSPESIEEKSIEYE